MDEVISSKRIVIKILLNNFRQILNIFKDFSPSVNFLISPQKISMFSNLNGLYIYNDLEYISLNAYDKDDEELEHPTKDFEEFSIYVNIANIKISFFNKNTIIYIKVFPDSKILHIENIDRVAVTKEGGKVISTNTLMATKIEVNDSMIFSTDFFNPEYIVTKTYIHLTNFLGFLKSIECNKCIKCKITKDKFYFSSIGEDTPTFNWMDAFPESTFDFEEVSAKLDKEKLTKLKALKIERIICHLMYKDSKIAGLYFMPIPNTKSKMRIDKIKLFFEFEKECKILFS
ncbi:late transcription factor VLTF-1 [Carp edema virus]|nr:late transcription factor VLTF-1 [Carp edema virus]